MPSLDVTFTEAELEEIRTSSADVSLESYVRDSAVNAARSRATLAAQLAHRIAATSAELNARLA